ncbi:MAG: hypothetical protein KY476_06485 [Planctomycetes bacterium]|nr:hypothetical protein [Planctomycetota bacterium]
MQGFSFRTGWLRTGVTPLAVLAGALSGCGDEAADGPQGTNAVSPGTRGVGEGAPPTGVRQNPAQPQSARPREMSP